MGLVADESAAIAAIIEGVPDSGVVYAYQSVPRNDWAAFVASFSTEIDGVRMVAAWQVIQTGETRTRKTIAIGASKLTRSTSWLIRGFRSWHEPDSDPAFRDLVEAIADKIDRAPSLNGACDDHDPVSWAFPNDGAAVVLGDVRCHMVEMRLTARKDVTLATA